MEKVGLYEKNDSTKKVYMHFINRYTNHIAILYKNIKVSQKIRKTEKQYMRINNNSIMMFLRFKMRR